MCVCVCVGEIIGSRMNCAPKGKTQSEDKGHVKMNALDSPILAPPNASLNMGAGA